MKKHHILIVEDEPSIADNIVLALEQEGYLTTWHSTIENADKAFGEKQFDLIVLDIGLPDGSGFDFCRKMRMTSEVPVIMLTARSDEIDRVVGLEIGADDYVTKPFSPRELVARIRAVLRRTSRDIKVEASKISSNGFLINKENFEASLNGQSLNLAPHEFGLLVALVESPGRIFSRGQLLEKVWKDPHAALERTVDAHIKTLRAKIKAVVDRELIVTHRGFGYSLLKDI